MAKKSESSTKPPETPISAAPIESISAEAVQLDNADVSTKKSKTGVTYTAYADFDFVFNHKTYAYKRGDSFTPPEGFKEVPGDPMIQGITFRFSTYLKTVDEIKGEEHESEVPHLLILPLTRG